MEQGGTMSCEGRWTALSGGQTVAALLSSWQHHDRDLRAQSRPIQAGRFQSATGSKQERYQRLRVSGQSGPETAGEGRALEGHGLTWHSNLPPLHGTQAVKSLRAVLMVCLSFSVRGKFKRHQTLLSHSRPGDGQNVKFGYRHL